MGLGPCTLRDGRSYPVCSTNANLNVRRALYQENPLEAALIGAVDLNDDVGYQEYHGLKLSAQRRAVRGINLNANYTLSRCIGTDTPNTWNQISSGYTNPYDSTFDEGYCDQDRKHLATLTAGYEIADVGSGVVGVLASRWRVTGILNARTGNRINVTTGIDNAFTGQRDQRPNKISNDVYPAERTLTNYFNRAAFAQPEPGGYGNLKRNALVGPHFWSVDLAVSRQVSVGGMQALELRLETFNLFNTFNWGDPGTDQAAGGTIANINSGQFGRIITQAGLPRIIQLGFKYTF
jgi:hypothetical protein